MTMRNLKELGMKPRRGNPYAPATNDQIATFEQFFEIILPRDFVTFLKFSNGGRPTLRLFPDPRGGFGEINDFYGLGQPESDESVQKRSAQSWDHGNLYGETRMWRPIIGNQAIPFGRDGGNNQLFLDYSSDPPQVGRLNSSTRKSRCIFDSFEALINALRATE